MESPALMLSLVFCALLVAGLITRTVLASRQIRHVARHRATVPAAFAQTITPEAHQKAADYTITKARFGLLDTALEAAMLLGWTLLGGLDWLNQTLLAALGGGMVQQLTLLAAFSLIGGLIGLPLAWWSTFRIEERFGFNKMRLGLWLGDLVKNAVVGALIGLVNGLIVAYLNVTPFITTLGTMIIVYGINSLYFDSVGASPVAGFDPRFSSFAQGFIRIGGFKLSYLTFYAAIASVFVWVLWNKTRFGKNIFAIGGNPEAAKVSGVNVAVNLVMIYALAGVFYAFGGMLEAGRIGSATNNLGFMYELDAIAACVVGGVSFAGGVGTVAGVITGVLIFTLINYGLTYIGVSPYWQFIIKGGIIILAVALDSMKYAKKK